MKTTSAIALRFAPSDSREPVVAALGGQLNSSDLDDYHLSHVLDSLEMLGGPQVAEYLESFETYLKDPTRSTPVRRNAADALIGCGSLSFLLDLYYESDREGQVSILDSITVYRAHQGWDPPVTEEKKASIREIYLDGLRSKDKEVHDRAFQGLWMIMGPSSDSESPEQLGINRDFVEMLRDVRKNESDEGLLYRYDALLSNFNESYQFIIAEQ